MIKPRRRTGAAAVCRSARKAGIMASSSGRAKAVPAPRSTVRRERCVSVTSIIRLLPQWFASFGLPHLKWHTLDNSSDEIGKAVPVFLGASHDFTNGRLISCVQLTAERIRHEPLDRGPREFFGMVE